MLRSFVAFAFLATAGLALAGTGCSSAPAKPEVKPGPAIPDLNLSGKWYSREFGDMELVQQGKNLVTGRYEDPRGPDHNGTLRGTIEGDILWIEWIKPGNAVAAIFPARGRGWLRISRDQKVMEGRWGFDDDNANGGGWKAEKSSFQ